MLAPGLILLLLILALPWQPPVRYVLRRGRIGDVNNHNAVSVYTHRAFLMCETVIWRSVQISVLAAVVVIPMRTATGLSLASRITEVSAEF